MSYPTPASDEARACGCTCVRIQGRVWVHGDCPVHRARGGA